jgi:hypothetical protein
MCEEITGRNSASRPKACIPSCWFCRLGKYVPSRYCHIVGSLVLEGFGKFTPEKSKPLHAFGGFKPQHAKRYTYHGLSASSSSPIKLRGTIAWIFSMTHQMNGKWWKHIQSPLIQKSLCFLLQLGAQHNSRGFWWEIHKTIPMMRD